MANLDFLLRNTHFKTYLNNAHNPEEVLDRWEKALDTDKVHGLLKAFPKTFDEDETYSSLLLNLTANYNQIINKLPEGFSVIEAEESNELVHLGITNQIDIYFNNILSKERHKPSTSKIACMSFYFLDSKKGKELRIEEVQGEISTARGHFSDKEIQRVFGKLSTFYGVNWKQGLLQQVYDYGKELGMNVKGEIPGIFHFYNGTSSMPQYPIYTIDYLTAYVNIGIPTDDIIISPVPEDIQSQWDKAFSFMKTKTNKEKDLLMKRANNAYREEYKLYKKDLDEQKLTHSDFEEKFKKTYIKIFSEVFSDRPAKESAPSNTPSMIYVA